jgi:type II secretory pathway pseudopilin PulG
MLVCKNPKAKSNRRRARGFTITELVIIIVVIGILGAIVFVGYQGAQAKTRDTSVLSDINALDALEDNYGQWNNVVGKAWNSANGIDTDLKFTPSSGNVIDVVTNSKDYCIRGYNPNGNKNSIYNAYTKESSAGTCDKLGPSIASQGGCPTGFIPVPGSPTYGTSEFCVMKYEAKQVGTSNVPVSQASGLPWASISQVNAIANSKNVAGCTGCHLITEAEWLTIAQNVLQDPRNWISGVVGAEYIFDTYGHAYMFTGNTDNEGSTVPGYLAGPLAASTDDSDGYYGTSNLATDGKDANWTLGKAQRRTLYLSNNEVIWDLAGNCWEWTSGTSVNNQPGVPGGGYTFRKWSDMTAPGSLSPDPSPLGTGISGISSWGFNNEMSMVYSNSDETRTMGYIRGAYWDDGMAGNPLTLWLGDRPTAAMASTTFRAAR